MRIRPTEPTAALAALISGNHRYLAARQNASVTSDEVALPRAGRGETTPVAPPFAAVVANGMDAGELATVFDTHERSLLVLAAEGLQVANEVGSGGIVDCAFATTSIVILVAVSRLIVPRFASSAQPELSIHFDTPSHLGGPALADAEQRSFDVLERALLDSPSLRMRVELRQVRAVAAVFDPTTGRVHWLGEHPSQTQLLRG